MIVVADASPLILLAAVNQLDLLPQLYGQVAVPQTVFDEVVGQGSGRPGAAELQSAPWVVIHPDPAVPASSTLDSGEAKAIALALRLHADLLVIDERQGRVEAVRSGIEIIGVLGVLMVARDKGLISSLRPVLDQLRQDAGYWISTALYRSALRHADESE